MSSEIPHPRVETIIIDQDHTTRAILDGPLWLPRGAVIELGDPNRDAVVEDRPTAVERNACLDLIDVVDTQDQFVERVVSG